MNTKLVTAYYPLHQGPPFWGKQNRERWYKHSIASICGTGVPVICYTDEIGYKEINEIKTNKKLDNLILKMYDLTTSPFHDRIYKARTEGHPEMYNNEFHPYYKMPVSIYWMKWNFLKMEHEEDTYIYWMDLEWLGVGSVRMGFVINGQFIVCHTFNHANIITSTYITTACLPLRYQIFNDDDTDSSSILKQICSTVISEGGYELRGKQSSIGTPITTPRTFAVAGTYYPIVALQLKTTRLDGIVIVTAASLLGLGNGKSYEWRVVNGNVNVTGGSWVDASPESSVQYNITGTGVTGGRVLASGYVNSSNQGSPSINILKEALFS